MPTYEYKREDGTRFEINQKMSESSLTVCPTTGQKVKRIISGGGGVVYKGEGWYVTDYKNGGQKKDPESQPKPDSDSSSKTEPKKEPKPESPSDK